MAATAGNQNAHTGVLHHYAPRLVAFEWVPQPETPTVSYEELSTIVFVGGLFDDLLTVPFVPEIAANLPPRWRLMQVRLSSSSTGFGISSLDTDVKELSQCIAYIRSVRPTGKVVLMGHSTGSQDVMHYAISPLSEGEESRAAVDGYVLQSAISDPEALTTIDDGQFVASDEFKKSIELAKQWVQEGKGDDILPKKNAGFFFPATANRWLSLVSPGPEHAGEDDMFSSYLSDERFKSTFGKLGATKTPVQILNSGSDQFIPNSVDKNALVARWVKIIKEQGGIVHQQSGIVPDMDHNGETVTAEIRHGVVQRVTAFVESIK